MSKPSKALVESNGGNWLTPERLAARKAATERSPEELARLAALREHENRKAIDAMNSRYREFGSMGVRIYEWRKARAQHLV